MNSCALSLSKGQPLNTCVLNVAHLVGRDERSHPGSRVDRFHSKQVSKIDSVNNWIFNIQCDFCSIQAVLWVTRQSIWDWRLH